MTLSFDYNSSDFDPPAPFISGIVLERPESRRRLSVVGQIDTGADSTLIDSRIVTQLRLAKSDEIDLEDFRGNLEPAFVYSARVIIDPVFDDLVAVSAVSDLDVQVLIGRDIINEWFMELWGPSFNGIIRSSHQS